MNELEQPGREYPVRLNPKNSVPAWQVILLIQQQLSSVQIVKKSASEGEYSLVFPELAQAETEGRMEEVMANLAPLVQLVK